MISSREGIFCEIRTCETTVRDSYRLIGDDPLHDVEYANKQLKIVFLLLN